MFLLENKSLKLEALFIVKSDTCELLVRLWQYSELDSGHVNSICFQMRLYHEISFFLFRQVQHVM